MELKGCDIAVCFFGKPLTGGHRVHAPAALALGDDGSPSRDITLLRAAVLRCELMMGIR